MTTKKIREALALLRDAETCAGELSGYAEAAAAALAEVEAIEKAARTVELYFEVPISMGNDQKCMDARLLMRAIAKESKP